MKRIFVGIVSMIALCISSAGFAEEVPSVKPNFCKGPVLCPSFPIYGKDRDCCNMYGGHIDIGFLWEQPWFQNMNPGEAYLDADGNHSELLERCFPYSFGVNASLGFATDHDNWYVGAKFDWLSASITRKSIANAFGIEPIPSFSTSVLLEANAGNDIFYSANINIYALDVAISRGSYHSTCFSYEPFAGVKALWFDGSQSSLAGASRDNINTLNYTSNEVGWNFSAWGVGPMFGFNGEYHFTHSFSLFSDSDVGVLYGRFRNRYYQTAVGNGTADLDRSSISNSNQQYFIPIRSILGLKLAAFCMEDQHYVAVKIGYDARYVFSYSTGSDFAASGLYVNFIWDF